MGLLDDVKPPVVLCCVVCAGIDCPWGEIVSSVLHGHNKMTSLMTSLTQHSLSLGCEGWQWVEG